VTSWEREEAHHPRRISGHILDEVGVLPHLSSAPIGTLCSVPSSRLLIVRLSASVCGTASTTAVYRTRCSDALQTEDILRFAMGELVFLGADPPDSYMPSSRY
jgi:hypothetical protein